MNQSDMHFNFKPNARVTLQPNVNEPTCGSTRFRWFTHFALPYPIPSKSGIREIRRKLDYDFQIDLACGVDRHITLPPSENAIPVVSLTNRKQHDIASEDGTDSYREELQGMAYCLDTREYPSLKDCLSEQEDKLTASFQCCQEMIHSLQKSLPYTVNWSVFPLSFYDCGSIYCGVDHYCPNLNKWVRVVDGMSVCIPRRLLYPTFVISEILTPPNEVMDLCNELLCESHVALMRDLPRSAVIHACTAVEMLANHTYVFLRSQQLQDKGLPLDDAREIADDERRSKRTDERFLLHKGLKKAAGVSLLEDDKALYDDFGKYKQSRHKIAHAGVSPVMDDARACYACACRVITWLCQKSNISHPALSPDVVSYIPGFTVTPGETYRLSDHETKVLARFLTICSNNEPK
ncbi:hypothetical protein OT109_06165 [Phycisphaeraceae bacterium D3-23]